jgi:hypothetical protein
VDCAFKTWYLPPLIPNTPAMHQAQTNNKANEDACHLILSLYRSWSILILLSLNLDFSLDFSCSPFDTVAGTISNFRRDDG